MRIRLNHCGDAGGIGNPEQKRLNRFVGRNDAIGQKIAADRAVEVKASETAAGKHVGVEAGQIPVISTELERMLALRPGERVEELQSSVGAERRRRAARSLISGQHYVRYRIP